MTFLAPPWPIHSFQIELQTIKIIQNFNDVIRIQFSNCKQFFLSHRQIIGFTFSHEIKTILQIYTTTKKKKKIYSFPRGLVFFLSLSAKTNYIILAVSTVKFLQRSLSQFFCFLLHLHHTQPARPHKVSGAGCKVLSSIVEF